MLTFDQRVTIQYYKPLALLIAGILPIGLANVAHADCNGTKVRGSTAKKVEVILKNESSNAIAVTIFKADLKLDGETVYEAVKDQAIAAGTKLDYSTGIGGDNAFKGFRVEYLNQTNRFSIENENASGTSPDKSTFVGTGMPPDTGDIACDLTFKTGTNRWSVQITLN